MISYKDISDIPYYQLYKKLTHREIDARIKNYCGLETDQYLNFLDDLNQIKGAIFRLNEKEFIRFLEIREEDLNYLNDDLMKKKETYLPYPTDLCLAFLRTKELTV